MAREFPPYEGELELLDGQTSSIPRGFLSAVSQPIHFA